MSKISNALMKELHSVVYQSAANMANLLLSEGELKHPLLHLSQEATNEWRTLSLTSRQKDVLRKCLVASGQTIVFNTLSILDGVSDIDSTIPDLALVNRMTKEEISDQYLHDEFIGVLDE